MSLLVVSEIEEPKRYDTIDTWLPPSVVGLTELDWNTNVSGHGSYIKTCDFHIPSHEHWSHDSYMRMILGKVVVRIRGIQDILFPYSLYKEYLK